MRVSSCSIVCEISNNSAGCRRMKFAARDRHARRGDGQAALMRRQEAYAEESRSNATQLVYPAFASSGVVCVVDGVRLMPMPGRKDRTARRGQTVQASTHLEAA